MEFDRVYETLGLIGKQDSVTIENALDLFYDFYEDVKTEEGSVLEQQPLGDRDEVIGRLCWLARMAARLYSRNKEELNAPEYAARWEKAQAKLAEAQEELSAVEGEAGRWRAYRKELDSVLASARAQQDEAGLAERLCREKEEQIARLQTLEKECEAIRKEIEENRTHRLPVLEKRKQEAMKEQEDIRKETALKEAEARAQCGKLKEAKEQAAECEEQMRLLANRLEELKEKEREAAEKKTALAADAEILEEQCRERLKEAEEAEGFLEKIKLSYQEPLKAAQEKADMLYRCTAAWRADPVLQRDWPFDIKMARQLGAEMEAAKKEAESALERYRRRYCSLVECLEGGDKRK